MAEVTLDSCRLLVLLTKVNHSLRVVRMLVEELALDYTSPCSGLVRDLSDITEDDVEAIKDQIATP